VGSTDNVNEDEDEGEEENRDESMDFSKAKINDGPISKNVPKSRTMNINLTGYFTTPITSDIIIR